MRLIYRALFLICVVVAVYKLFGPIAPAYKATQEANRNTLAACQNVESAMVALIQSEITIHTAVVFLDQGTSDLHFPATLDDAQDGPASSTNKLFTTVFEGGVEDDHWFKKSNEYIHTCDGKIRRFIYDPRKGTFASPDHVFR